jgi:uncharacterized protein (DUF885 family)
MSCTVLNRRALLTLTVAAVAAGPARTARAADSGVTALLDELMQRALLTSPQLMTMTGLDTGPNAAARGRLDDRSPAGIDVMRRLFQDLKIGLDRFDPEKLSASDWVNHQSAVYLTDTTLQSYGFGYGDPNVGIAVPYLISQLTGAYRNVPSFLAHQHPMATAADAEAYVSRLSAFAILLDQETDRARADFAKGVVPPDFVIRTTLVQFAELMRPAPADNEMVTTLVRRAQAANIVGDWQARGGRVVEREVYPALGRQADLLKAALPTASVAARTA